MFLHLSKLPAFLYLRHAAAQSGGIVSSPFRFADLGMLAALMAIAVIPGTLIGKRLLKHVSEQAFVVLFKIALTVAGLKTLFIDGLWLLLG